MKLFFATTLLLAGVLACTSTAQDPTHEPFDPHDQVCEDKQLHQAAGAPVGIFGNAHSRSLGQAFKKSTKRYKNVIMMIPDGCDETVQTLAHIYKGEDLQLDKMPSTGVRTNMANSMITGSAAAATAFSTGHKTTVRFLSVGPRTEDLLPIYQAKDMTPPYAPMATILEAAKYLGKGTGLVSTSRVSHATPAAFACHIDDRGKDNDIMEHIVYNNLDVVMGGGKRHLLPAEDCLNTTEGGTTTVGGKRTDCQNLEQVLLDRGYKIWETKDDMDDCEGTEEKVYGMFAMSHMQPDVDRKHFAPEQPSLAEMTKASIDILSKKEKGFFMMVEGSQVDWAGHNNDPFYMMTDFVAFDDAVKVAVDFAEAEGDTLVLVFPDHNTGGMKIGNYGHGYTNITLEAVRGPFLGMSMTANGVVSFVPEANAANEDMIDAVKAHWRLDITEQDVDDIYIYKSSSGKSLSYSMARLLSERYTYIGWTTHGHNGETVPLRMYGGDVPPQIIDNTDLALMAAAAFGLDNLDSLTDELYVDLNTTGMAFLLDIVDTTNPVAVSATGDGTAFPIGKDYMLNANGDMISLPGLNVYAPKTGKVYVSAKAMSILKGEEHISKVVLPADQIVSGDDDDDNDVNEEAIVVGVVLGAACIALALALVVVINNNNKQTSTSKVTNNNKTGRGSEQPVKEDA